MIQNPLRTPLTLHAPAFLACAVFSLPLLPSRASSLSVSAGLRLPSSPRALFLPWLVLPASLPSVLFGVVGFPPFLLAGLFLVLFGASLCCLSLSALAFCMKVYGYTRCAVTMFGLECMLHFTLEFVSK